MQVWYGGIYPIYTLYTLYIPYIYPIYTLYNPYIYPIYTHNLHTSHNFYTHTYIPTYTHTHTGLSEVFALSKQADGPSRFLLDLIDTHGGVAPADWMGYRNDF
jgi:hypothetical protein